MLGPCTSAKKLANSSLWELLPYTYRCCILGGSFFLDHSFAMALYFHCFLSLNFFSTWVRTFLYAQRKSGDPGKLCESLTANFFIFLHFMVVKTSRYDHFQVFKKDFFDSCLVLPYKYSRMSYKYVRRAQSSRGFTYIDCSLSIELCIFLPSFLDIVGSLFDYFLPMICVYMFELGSAPFQHAHVFICKHNFLARYAFLFQCWPSISKWYAHLSLAIWLLVGGADFFATSLIFA